MADGSQWHQPTLRDRLRYAFDDFMSRGTVALILGLFAISTALVLMVAAVVTITDNLRDANGGEGLDFFDAVWLSLLRTLDPGTMGGDRGQVGFVLSMFVVTMGGIFIVATLISIVSSGLEGKLADLRKGRSRVIERDHTVIVGWNPAIFTIVAELVEANANHRGGTVVILADRDRVGMEDEIWARVPDRRGTHIVCRSGSPIDVDEIDVASVQTSRSIIVLSGAADDPDTDVIKTVLAITNDPDRRTERYHIVAELRDPRNVEIVRMVAEEEVEAVATGDLIARIVAQACREPGLSEIYLDLLDYAGDELYVVHEPALAGRTFGEALRMYEDSALVGLFTEYGTARIAPPMDTIVGADDRVVVISADDDTIHLAATQVPVTRDAIVSGRRTPPSAERTLVLGWSPLATSIVRELDQALGRGSEIVVVSPTQAAGSAVHALSQELTETALTYTPGETTSRAVLDRLDVPSFDHVVILGAGGGEDPQRADARTLLSLLHLRDIARRTGTTFSIVSEMADVRNRDLAVVARADDFIVSDRLVSLVVTQISEDRRLARVLEELLDSHGASIHLRPAEELVTLGREVTFATVVESASGQGDVAVGYRVAAQGGAHDRYGVHLNPAKSALVRFERGDRVIVIGHPIRE